MPQIFTGKAPSASVAARPRLGFLGVGWISRHRMKAILETGAIEVTAVADPSPEMAEEAQRRGSNQGNTQNEKFLYHQSFIDFWCYLELARFEPRRLSGWSRTRSWS